MAEEPGLPERDRASYLLDELLLVQKVEAGDAVLLLQGQRKVLDTSDGQLLLHREDDVLAAEGKRGHPMSGETSRAFLQLPQKKKLVLLCPLLTQAGPRPPMLDL